jgi:hypothetical protein
MPLREDIDQYFRTYDRTSFNVFAAGPDAPGDGEVEDFERHVGFRLPEEFRDFTMSQLGGLYIEAKEELWPRAKLYDVGPFWSFCYGVAVFGLSEQAPEWLDLRAAYDALTAGGAVDLVPILRVMGDADRWCYTRDGTIVRWHHDDPDALPPFDGTFSDLLLRELHELEGRLARRRAEHTASGS